MSKVTVEFNLPEDQSDFDLFKQSDNLYGALWDIYMWSQRDDAPDSVRSMVSQLIKDHNVVL